MTATWGTSKTHGKPEFLNYMGQDRKQPRTPRLVKVTYNPQSFVMEDPTTGERVVNGGVATRYWAEPAEAPTTKTEEAVTTTVRKGANRPAAAARTAKAAQRTPLPAKGATKGHGKETTAKVVREELAKGKAPKVQPERPTPHAKAAALVEYATKAGWTAVIEKGETATDICTFRAVRDAEDVTLHWIEGGTRPGTHNNGARRVQAMNAATVRRILDTSAEAAAQVRAAYASGSGKAKRAAVRVATAAPLPFDLDTATPEEIVAAVMNRTVTWTNGISGSSETAVVTGKGKNAPKVTGEGNARALTFWAKGEGSRSVRLLSLVSVS